MHTARTLQPALLQTAHRRHLPALLQLASAAEATETSPASLRHVRTNHRPLSTAAWVLPDGCFGILRCALCITA